MGEFLDVIRQTKRICKSVNGNCGKCLMGAFSCPNNARFDSTDEQKFIDFANAVMEWAADHPEPVYPTWGEWFVEHGDLVDGWQNATNAAWMANTALSIFMKPIPADIAEKLGIEPKEGV